MASTAATSSKLLAPRVPPDAVERTQPHRCARRCHALPAHHRGGRHRLRQVDPASRRGQPTTRRPGTRSIGPTAIRACSRQASRWRCASERPDSPSTRRCSPVARRPTTPTPPAWPGSSPSRSPSISAPTWRSWSTTPTSSTARRARRCSPRSAAMRRPASTWCCSRSARPRSRSHGSARRRRCSSSVAPSWRSR